MSNESILTPDAAATRAPVQALWLPADDRGGHRPGLRGPLLVDGGDRDVPGGALRLAQLLAGRDPVRVNVRATGAALRNRVAALSAAARSDAAAYVLSGLPATGTREREDAGDLTCRLAAEAAVPVLAVPPRLHALPRSVLSVVDGGDASMEAARAALPLLGEFASLTLLHLVLSDAPGGPGSPAGEGGLQRGVDALRRLAKEIGDSADVAVHLVVLQGDPRTVLAGWVPGFDLVTLGAPSRGDIQPDSETSLPGIVFESALGTILVAPTRISHMSA